MLDNQDLQEVLLQNTQEEPQEEPQDSQEKQTIEDEECAISSGESNSPNEFNLDDLDESSMGEFDF